MTRVKRVNTRFFQIFTEHVKSVKFVVGDQADQRVGVRVRGVASSNTP
jgi:hypothetical protein